MKLGLEEMKVVSSKELVSKNTVWLSPSPHSYILHSQLSQ